MPPDEQDKLDALIESALRDEPEQGVPFGFHRAVDERLHMAALLDLERGRFRRCWISAGAFVSLVALASAVGWIAADVGGTISRTVPGALGSYDQFVLLLVRYWPAMTATSAAMAALLGTAYFVLSRSASAQRPASHRG